MNRNQSRRWRIQGCAALAWCIVVALAPFCRAITPNDPKVKDMVQRGIKYLESGEDQDGYSGTLGGKCLTALAIYKYYADLDPEKLDAAKNHPKVLDALATCHEFSLNTKQRVVGDFNYSLGLAIIFLCEVDAQKYSQEIQALLEMLRYRQRPDGAWSYPEYETGDTSQTQYGALATWMAHTHNFRADRDSVERMANWIIRTQDVSGAFPYQGKDPGSFQRIQQDKGEQGLRLSMSPAALGSLYIAADILQINFQEEQPTEAQKNDPFQKVVVAEAAPTFDKARLLEALQLGMSYYDREFRIDLPKNAHYYLYSLERYQSFREHIEKRKVKEPAWYNAGVDYLAKTQDKSGFWEGTRGRIIDTAFSLLFLVRGTEKIIHQVYDGALTGGHTLPDDLTKIKLQEGQIVSTDVSGDIGSLMDLIEQGNLVDSDALIAKIDMVQLDPKKKESDIDRLKKMVSGNNYQSRLLAVRALSNAGDLDNVPVLIYALSDPDARVAREAHDGLRIVSRRFSMGRLPEKPTLEQKRAAQLAWRDWLKTVRPDIEIPSGVFTAGK